MKDKDHVTLACAGSDTQLPANYACVDYHVTPGTSIEEQDTSLFEIYLKEEPPEKTANDIFYNSLLQTIMKRENAVENSEGCSDIKQEITDENVDQNQTDVDIKVQEKETIKAEICDEIKAENFDNDIENCSESFAKITEITIKKENIEDNNIGDTNEITKLNDKETSKIENNIKANSVLNKIIIIDDDIGNDKMEECSITEEEKIENIICEDVNLSDSVKNVDFDKIQNSKENYKQTYKVENSIKGNLTLNKLIIIDDGIGKDKMAECSITEEKNIENNIICKDLNLSVSAKNDELDKIQKSKDDFEKEESTNDTQGNTLLNFTTVTVGNNENMNVVIYQCSACNIILPSLDSLNKHKNSCISKNQDYSCSKCDKKFNSYGISAKHIEMCPNTIMNVKCDICNKMFNSLTSMTNHKVNVHHAVKKQADSIAVYQCTVCNMILPTQNSLDTHKKICINKNQKGYRCYKCNKIFSSYGPSAKHAEICCNTNEKCDICNQIFDNVNNMIYHKIKEHNKKPDDACMSNDYPCCKCYETFTSYSALKLHIEVCPTIERNVKCGICNVMFNNLYNMLEHKRNVHNHTVYQCSECNLILPTQEFDSHKKSCKSQNQDYPCCKCDQIFPCYDTLTKHIKICPNTVIGVKCNVCSKMFNSHNSMLQHRVQVHNTVKSHKCDKCEKSYVTLNRLLKHKKDHIEVLCVLCNKPFANHKLLKSHMKRHYGTKEFMCSICDREFYSNLDVREHKKAKHGINDLTCYVCKEKFENEEDLTEHLKGHNSTEILQLAKNGLL